MASHLGNSWDELLRGEFDSEYFDRLREFLRAEYAAHTVYPPKRDILAAFAHTPYENVKVVVIGQDPYIGERQANGMCFSVGEGVKCPPSLVNIYKALEYDLGIPPTSCGDLSGWAEQGVLLLNAVLTVRAGASGSHAGKGWERFTDFVISLLNKSEKPIVFMLWGGYAKKRARSSRIPNILSSLPCTLRRSLFIKAFWNAAIFPKPTSFSRQTAGLPFAGS